MNNYTMFDLIKETDLYNLFLNVTISNHEEVDGFDYECFKKIMKRNIEFEKHSDALWFMGMQTYIRRNESSFTDVDFERIKLGNEYPERELMELLLAIRKFNSPELTLKLSAPKTNIKTSNANVIKALKLYLESINLGYENKKLKDVSDFDLSNYIKEKKTIPHKKGALNKQYKVACLAVDLVCLIYWDEYMIRKKQFDIKYSDKDCRLIYDYLLFWKLIEDRDSDKTTTTSKKNYIRTMIQNIRKYR